MNRRSFLKNISFAFGGLALSSNTACTAFQNKELKFGLSTDIHKDIMNDANQRLEAFITHARHQNVDFIIDLGDFCHPTEENKGFVDIWNSWSGAKFNVLGNHDMDKGTKQDFMDFVGMKEKYYSFDQGDFHFVVLDPNTLKIDGEYIPYEHANFYKPQEQRAYIDPQQLEWLEQDLQSTNKHCIIFSHQSFENPASCKNQKQVRELFEKENRRAGFHKVAAAFSGHDHSDYSKEISGIHYVQMNSMSYSWVGDKYKCPERFPEEVNEAYPLMKYTLPYKEPLYAVVTIKDGHIGIKGVDGTFIEPGPEDVGLSEGTANGLPLAAKISDRTLSF
jgi:calcineurin-like phosphoesterase family protein